MSKKLLFISLFFLSLIISYWTYMEIFFFYTPSIFRELYTYFFGEYWVTPTCIVIMTIFLCTFLYQLITKRFEYIWIKSFYSLYLVLLFYFLLLKSVGIRGLELNLFSFFSDIINGDSFIVFINILMFIPLGILFPLEKKNTIIILSFILLIESIQFIFYLGIFDLGDVVANIIGCFIGTKIYQNTYFKKIIISKIDS